MDAVTCDQPINPGKFPALHFSVSLSRKPDPIADQFDARCRLYIGPQRKVRHKKDERSNYKKDQIY